MGNIILTSNNVDSKAELIEGLKIVKLRLFCWEEKHNKAKVSLR